MMKEGREILKKYTEEERPIGYGKCYDCDLDYEDFPGDLVVNNVLWEVISPTNQQGGGILCANCMLHRLSELGLCCLRLEVGSIIRVGELKKIPTEGR
jgi:hypothetical protein